MLIAHGMRPRRNGRRRGQQAASERSGHPARARRPFLLSLAICFPSHHPPPPRALLPAPSLPSQIDDLKQFRQWGSRTPGHPENFETEGVEVTTGEQKRGRGDRRGKKTRGGQEGRGPAAWPSLARASTLSSPLSLNLTHPLSSALLPPLSSFHLPPLPNTGPLGQGICNAVGLAAAEAHLGARFNKPDAKVVDHYTYCIMGDGCNMEGISTEAASLAGHWGLGKLIVLYDDNKISIDGHTDISFTEDVSARYAAQGWHCQHVKDGNLDLAGLEKAINAAKATTDKPSFIKVSTLIGYGSPNKADSHDVHGAPLGKDETAATRANLKWDHGEFEVPQTAYDVFGEVAKRGQAKHKAWDATMAAYKAKYPAEAAELASLLSNKLPAGWEAALPSFTPEDKGLATRLHSQTMLNALAPALPGFLGGSADLAPSNMTLMKMYGDFQKNSYAERNLRFGVREHAMGAICNGLALHGTGLIHYCATFFIFTDYMRSAMRMSALSQAGVIYVMTHDSIGLGEDGPTHQPIEHLASFRAMPSMLTMRPGDGNETAGCYKAAVKNASGENPEGKKRPSTLALSRQGMPNQPGTSIEGTTKGGYIVHGGDGKPDAILIATGSELMLAIDAAKDLEGAGMKVRVVSMPCTELFDEQTAAYKESVLPKAVRARVSVEAGSTFGWERYTTTDGIQIGVDTFGASAPADRLYKEFGITKDAVVAAAKKVSGK